jgi:hypothetical protein
MRKSDVYDIIEEKKISLWKLYVEEEGKADPRMKAKNDGVSYGGADFIKYVPDETDKTKEAWKRGYFWSSNIYCIYWDDKTTILPYEATTFIFGRTPRTETGKYVKSVFKVINSIESDVQAFGTQYQLKKGA